MTSVAVETDRDQVVRWMQDGRHVLEIIMKLLNECDQLKATVDVAEQENQQLRADSERLRAEIAQLRADNERGQKERAEIAQWFSTVMTEAASRLVIPRPPA